jgi:hypothetical protein
LVSWRIEHVVQSEREFYHAQVSPEVAAQLGDDVDDLVSNLLGDLRQLRAVELAQVVR